MPIEDVLVDPYPAIYEQVELLPFNPHGWHNNGPILEKIIALYAVRTIVEVGSWLGKCTRDCAAQIPEGGVVFAVDHWQGSADHRENEEVKTWLPHLYQQFLSNVVHAGLTHKIIPIRMESCAAAKRFEQLEMPIDLIYIDASHDYYSVYCDLEAWHPLIKQGGIFCGDDWFCRTVRDAVKDFAKSCNLAIYCERNFWAVY
ncbi:MAG TPA: class I SAM-dependent methyltransferase [Rhabdochlamydiaceae bacterium]|jgi:predicted O-methyltransferase YrrM